MELSIFQEMNYRFSGYAKLFDFKEKTQYTAKWQVPNLSKVQDLRVLSPAGLQTSRVYILGTAVLQPVSNTIGTGVLTGSFHQLRWHRGS